jgi:hypothetical protein
LSETHLRPGEALRFGNYVSHRTDRLPEAGGTAILVRRCMEQNHVPVLGLKHLETTAIHMVVTQAVRILAVYARPPSP